MTAQRIGVSKTWIFVSALGLLAGCSEDTAGSIPIESAEFTVLSGVETATVINAEPGVPLTLYNAEGEQLITIVSDDQGQAHFAYVPAEYAVIESGDAARLPLVDGNTLAPGAGYMIADESGSTHFQSDAFDVLAVDDIPDTSLYDGQVFTGVTTAVLGGLAPNENAADGLQYIEMRDGTTLSAMVRFPDPNVYGPGPYPTVVEYSGYSTSNPDGPEPGSFIANLLGYASVGVNMRGTGCSGGVFDVFNPAQHADGYDVVEAIARQEWVLGNRVGMVGLSYSGIAQLYVASTQPPSLAAVTPQSTIADSWEMQWPGGIYNSGFTRQWLAQRNDAAEAGGMDWVSRRVDEGDTVCADNLTLRTQNIDFESFLHGLEFRPLSADGRSLPLLLPNIDVPVYHTGAFQDEQTGALFASMFDRYENTPTKKITMYNGRHPDGYSPLVLTRWFEFLEFYVARRVPRLVPVVRAAAGAEFSAAFGVTGLGFEDDRFLDFDDDDYAGALAAYEAEPTVRVLFENGAGDEEQPGSPVGRFEASFDTWPPAAATNTTWYLDGDGLLADAAGSDGAGEFRFDPDAGDKTFFGPAGYELSVPLWDIDWTRFVAGAQLSYLTPAFDDDTVLAGAGYADLWIRSDVEDAAVQVTLTEVRPDGLETLVQSGWLRLGHRKLDPTAEDPAGRTYKIEDFEPMPVGEYVEVRVAIPSVAHAFRAGSQMRVAISTPGRNHGTWEFEAPEYDGAPTIAIAHGGTRASAITMPTISGIDVAEGLPACPSLRGQPCRTYESVTNTAAD